MGKRDSVRVGTVCRAAPVVLTAALSLVVASVALAADPGRWRETGRSTMPLYYYQGITSDPEQNFFFDGIHFGLYRTDSELNETGRNDDVIPPAVTATEGYNHIGDISWDAAEGGRILLPLECYYPGAPNGGNTCRTGSIGVADPASLQWRYYVKLDPSEISKAMWAETSPDGELLWTSSGDDLLAYRIADIRPSNAAPSGSTIKAVRRLPGAVPRSGITGAAFYDGRLFVAGQNAGPMQVHSVDLATGQSRLEIERDIVGESEGLDVADALGGVLHWQIQPYNNEGPPTYEPTNGSLLHFAPNSPPRASFTAQPNPARPNQTVTFDASSSSDPDGRIVSYRWDLDGDGAFETTTGSSPSTSTSYRRPQTVAVTLRVTDDDGASDEATVTVQVGPADRRQ